MKYFKAIESSNSKFFGQFEVNFFLSKNVKRGHL